MPATEMPMLTSSADHRKTGAASKSGSSELLSFTSAARRMKFATLALGIVLVWGRRRRRGNVQDAETEDAVDVEF